MPKLSVVVCTRNEESRIAKCLESVRENNPDEILVVDGASTDRTPEIAESYATRVIRSQAGSLVRDRQVGIDAARNELVAVIDADHRLKQGDLEALYRDLVDFDLDIVQSQLRAFDNSGFWVAAENEMWDLTHNIPGPRAMIGTAPAIYRKSKVFDRVRFDDHITATIEDTDLMYRISKFPELKVGIGRTVVFQEHAASLKTYLGKFKWYGKGDGEFCRKHPERTGSMVFHLLIRYPVVYPFRALCKGKFRVIPFFILQGWVRFYGLAKYLFTPKEPRKKA